MEGGFVIVVDFIETKFKLLGGKSFPACRKLNEIRWKISEKTKWTQKAEIENKNTVRRAFFHIDLRLCPIPNAATNTQVQWNLSPCLWAAGTYKVGYIRAVGALTTPVHRYNYDPPLKCYWQSHRKNITSLDVYKIESLRAETIAQSLGFTRTSDL